MSSHPDRHADLVDRLGSEICAGQLPPGTVLSADALVEQYGVARSVVREALRVLASMGLVSAKRGVGTTTQPMEEWSLLDPQVIAWRLASSQRDAQLRELAGLRLGVEPEAAAMAASHRESEAVSRLMSAGTALWDAAHREDPDAFLAADIAFHSLLLEASCNPMYVQFSPVIQSLLEGRFQHRLAAEHPRQVALQQHLTVVRAIQTGDVERARAECRALIQDAMQESDELGRTAH